MAAPHAFQASNGLPSPSSPEAPSCPSLTTGVVSLSTPSSLHGNRYFSTETAATESIGQSSTSHGEPSIQAISTRSREGGSPNVSRGVPAPGTTSVAAITDSHEHWCWVCEKRDNLSTCGGFERHVKEHFERHYCISLDLYTRSLKTCANCGTSNPDPEHLSQYNSHPCRGKSFSRASNLREHLDKEHGVNDYSKLVQFSKATSAQKYFSCGFCVFVSGSIRKQISHIHDHYKDSKQVRDWDPNKAILGLLSLNKDWQNFRAANQHRQDSSFSWSDTRLQKRLEMSQEPADDLFKAASTSLTNTEIDVSRPVQRPQYPDSMPPVPSRLGQTIDKDDLWSAPPVLPSQALYTIHKHRPLPRTTSETYVSPTSATYYQSQRHPHPVRSQTSSEGFLDGRSLAHQPRIASASDTSPVFESYPLQNSGFGGRSQMVSTNAVLNPSSQHIANSYHYPAQAPDASIGLHWTAQSQSSPFSYNSPSWSPNQNTIFLTDHQSLDRSQGEAVTGSRGFDVDDDYNQEQDDMRRQETHY